MTALLPCPFCGEGVGYYTGLRTVQRASELYRGLTDFWIECPACGATGPARTPTPSLGTQEEQDR